MDRLLEPGTYVVAVSGGIDSVTLLNMLSNDSHIDCIVAHFDHGIRKNSSRDAQFVQKLAETYGYTFVLGKGDLGSNASEATAREKRYTFLKKVVAAHGGRAIVTAHHQDDVIETALINLLRGTKRKGLTSLGSAEDIIRPLLHMTKHQIATYARAHNLEWREDESNNDEKYLRNKIRNILKTQNHAQKQKLVTIINQTHETNKEIDELLEAVFDSANDVIDRKIFVMLSYDVACEVLTDWLRAHHANFNSTRIGQLVQKAKTSKPGTHFDVDKQWVVSIQKDWIRMQPRQSV